MNQFIITACLCVLGLTLSSQPCHGEGCRGGFVTLRDRCYKFVTTKKTWHAANADCQGEGANLLTLETREEQHAVTSHSDTEYPGVFVWRTALTRDGNSGSWSAWHWTVNNGSALPLGTFHSWTKTLVMPTVVLQRWTSRNVWSWNGAWWGSYAAYICELTDEAKKLGEKLDEILDEADMKLGEKLAALNEAIFDLRSEQSKQKDVSP